MRQMVAYNWGENQWNIVRQLPENHPVKNGAAAYEWYGTKACDWEKFLCLIWVGGSVGAVVVYEGWLDMVIQLYLLCTQATQA